MGASGATCQASNVGRVLCGTLAVTENTEGTRAGLRESGVTGVVAAWSRAELACGTRFARTVLGIPCGERFARAQEKRSDTLTTLRSPKPAQVHSVFSVTASVPQSTRPTLPA